MNNNAVHILLGILLGVIVFLAPQTMSAAAGDVIWTQTVNPSITFESAEKIVVDGSGAYVVGEDYVAGGGQWRIEKRNLSTGAVIWTQNSNLSTSYDYARAVAVDGSGIYIVGNNTVTGGGQWHMEKRSLATGALIWTQTSNPSAGSEAAFAVTVDNTGVYVAGNDAATSNLQLRIEKRNLSTGALIWAQTSNPSTGIDTFYGVAVDSGGVYAVGIDAAPGNYQWRIEKRNLSTGAVIWTQVNNPSSGGDYAYQVAVDGSGIYIVGDDVAPGNTEWRIEKRNLSTGAVIWTQVNNLTSGSDSAINGVIDGNGIYVVGMDFVTGGGQWRIEKRSLSNGAFIWGQTENPSSASDFMYGIAVDGTGVYVAGFDRVPSNSQWRIQKRNKGTCTGTVAISWTDPTITANSTQIRKAHIDELRSWIDNRRVDAGLTAYSWTDPTITANSTQVRKVHIDQLRTAISDVYTACGQGAPSWTDPTITANSTQVRKVHIDELRSATSNAL